MAFPPHSVIDDFLHDWLLGDLSPGQRVRTEPARELSARGGTCRIARVYRHPPRAVCATSADAIPGAPRAEPALLLKVAPSGPSFERSAREYEFLSAFGHRADIRTPRLLGGVARPDLGVILLMEYLEPADGALRSVRGGCDQAEAERVLTALAGMHGPWRARVADRPPAFLPVWGTGTLRADRPHERRAERYARRLPTFLARYAAHLAPPMIDRLLAMSARLEDTLARAARWPHTLMHGDVHLENLILRALPGGDVALLDWQSVSVGPGLIDAVRFVLESARAGDGHAHAAPPKGEDVTRLVRQWAINAQEPGGADEAEARLSDATDIILAGFVSGYAGPSKGEPPDPALIELFAPHRLGRAAHL